VIFTEPRNPRAISAAQLAEICGHHAHRFRVITSAQDALEAVLAESQSGDAIFVAGSLYLAGELRYYWKNRPATANSD
jgi:folylpolyglutamate synthase/dihydropteroate synthase